MTPWFPIRLRKMRYFYQAAILLFVCAFGQGCTALYGWNIHAPGLLSEDFARDIPVATERLALYVPADMKSSVSKDKGTRLSDPQTYYLGESFVPMLVEAFQHGFEEFVLMETVPTAALMNQYGIDYLAVVEIKGLKNRKDMKGQGLDVFSETTLFGRDLKLKARYETKGSSDARRVFAKKGGPEVNLNAAIESNLSSVVVYLQDRIRTLKPA